MSLCSDITCCCNRPIRITLTPFQQHVLPCHAWSIVLQCMIPVQIRTVKKVCVWVFAVLCFWKGKPNTMNSKILIGHLLGTLSFTNSIFKFSLTVYRLHCYLSSIGTHTVYIRKGTFTGRTISAWLILSTPFLYHPSSLHCHVSWR